MIMTRLNIPEDVPIESGIVSKAIASAQHQVEQQNFEIRKNVLKYDEVMNKQRKVIYGERLRVLRGEDLHDQVEHMINDVVTAYVVEATSGGYAEDWDLEKLWTALKTLYPVGIRPQTLLEQDDDLTPEKLLEDVLADAHAAYARREAEIEAVAGPGKMRELERWVLLQVLDRKWREHLYEMDYLKEGIHLRQTAQRDPLIEYQREGYDMFMAMLDGLKEESVGFLFNAQVETEQPAQQAQPDAATAERLARAARAAEQAAIAQKAAEAEQSKIPPALRGRTLGAPTQQQQFTYSGPAEGGGVASRSDGNGSAQRGQTGGTRRERRAAERANTKQNQPRRGKGKRH
jgi:preprotein translocase subunit SecA